MPIRTPYSTRYSSSLCDIRVGAPWELYFADDLVITATSLEEFVDMSRWRKKEWSQKVFEYVHGLWARSGCLPGLFLSSFVLYATLV